jgi:hypothetical protein
MDTQKKLLVLAFKRPERGDPWINHLAGWWCNGFCHVELILETVGEREHLAFSIEGGGKSRMAIKTFAGQDYEYITLIVSMAEHKRVCDFCDSAAYIKYPYGNFAMVCAILPSGCVSSRSSKFWGTFCSKIVTEALQKGGIEEVDTLNPSYTTPGTLHRAMQHSNRRIRDSKDCVDLLEAWV